MSLRFAALLALLTTACREQDSPPSQNPQPVERKQGLALLTSLPLAFAEGFSLDAPPHPAMQRLERDFSVRLVDGPEDLAEGGLLLAAQPQALTAERLVALDDWVRKGGRILLLADPRLVWESERPLGDRLRPPMAYPDTGLLRHWGLLLEAPEEGGPAVRRLGGMDVLTGSPGTLTAEKDSSCEVAPDGLVARCDLGKGQAVVVADADFVQAGVRGGLDGPTERNHDALVAELGTLAD